MRIMVRDDVDIFFSLIKKIMNIYFFLALDDGDIDYMENSLGDLIHETPK